MQRIDLRAETRTETGKCPARRLRAQGFIPAVLYGGNKPPVSLTVPRRDLALAMQGHEGHNLLIELTVGSEEGKTLAFLKDILINPVNQIILHADLWRIDPNQPIRTTVSVHLNGTPIGVRQGGVQQLVLREVEIEALPSDLPERIDVDVSYMEMGQTLHVSDLVKEGLVYSVLTPGDRLISSVNDPKTLSGDGEAAGGSTDSAQAS